MFWKLTDLIFCLIYLFSTIPFRLNEDFDSLIGGYLISHFLLTPISVYILSMTISRVLINVLDGYGIKHV